MTPSDVLVGWKLVNAASGICCSAVVERVSASDELEVSLPPAVNAGGVPRAEVVGDRLAVLAGMLT